MGNSYQHRIHDTGDVEIEKRINRLAKRLPRLDKNKDAARILSYKEEICCLVGKYFFIQGADSNGLAAHDDAFITALKYALDKAMVSSDYPLTHTLRKKYSWARRDEGRNEVRLLNQHVYLDDHTAENLTASKQGSGRVTGYDSGNHARTSHPIIDISRVQDEHLEQALDTATTSYVELLSQTVEFLSSIRTNGSAAVRFWTPLFFSETLTRICKGGGCASIAESPSQEAKIFHTAEPQFLDSYTEDKCRTALALYKTEFVASLNIDELVSPEERIAAGRASAIWTLPAAVFISYCESTPKGAVSKAAVALQRTKYESLTAKFDHSFGKADLAN